jgi:rare lipoprotein A
LLKNVLILLIFCLVCVFAEAQEVGLASYYHDYFTGKTTANGEKYDPNQLTAAHKSLPLGTVIKVINQENNKSVIVRINDRGPYVKGRILDLSKVAAIQLGIIESGFAKVSYEIIENKPVVVQAKDSFVEQLPDERFYIVNQVDSAVKMSFGIKLGNYDDPKLAFIIAKELKTKYNATAYIQTVKLMKGSTYRIFVGNFSLQQEAEQLKETLKKYSPDCVVVNYATYK